MGKRLEVVQLGGGARTSGVLHRTCFTENNDYLGAWTEQDGGQRGTRNDEIELEARKEEERALRPVRVDSDRI